MKRLNVFISSCLASVGVLVVFVAERSMSVCCLWFLNQPKVPEELLKHSNDLE